jgi:hypothetical protein
MKKLILLYLIFSLIFPTFLWAERQDLDEALARKPRFPFNGGTNTFYSGESGTPYYFWQPETLTYTDTNFGTEIWRVTFNPRSGGGYDAYSNEYSTQAWCNDGSRLGFRSLLSGVIFTIRPSTDPNKDGSTTPRWTVNSDGTKMRAGTGKGQGNDYLNWLHTETAYLFTPRSTGEFSGALTDTLYKVSLDSNNTMTRSVLVNDIGGAGLKASTIKDPITSNDGWMVLQDETAGDWPTPNDINSMKLHFINLTTNTQDYAWGVARGIGPVGDPYGAITPAQEGRIRESSSAFLFNTDLWAHFYNMIPHMIWKKSGSAGDGGPAYADWDGDSFGDDEIKVISDNPVPATNLPHNPYDNGYMGHPEFDRWGHFVIGNNSQDCNSVIYGSSPTRYVRWGNNGCPGQMLLDVTNNLANPSWYDANNSNYMIGTGTSNVYYASHSSWKGWTDYIVSMHATNYDLYTQHYQKTSQTGKTNTQAPVYIASTELVAYQDNYASYPRPSQSPDGTKVAFATKLFYAAYSGADDDRIGISWVVAYYPYPPEIYQANGTGASLNIRFDWGTNSATWRGYTQRKWVNESTGTYLPPREINTTRLWVSTDNATWTPVTTVAANAWDRYNFATGAWTGNTYWEINTTQGVGTTRYYAITAIETSGLESKTLSNTWKVVLDGAGDITTQAQQTAYSSTPGGSSGFYTTAPSAPQTLVTTHRKSPATALGQYTVEWTEPASTTLVRHYNIYALDAAIPTAIQQRRIASISRNICSGGACSWVDWLGSQDASTVYGVTSIDTLGNESAIKLTGGGGTQPITLGTGPALRIGTGAGIAVY